MRNDFIFQLAFLFPVLSLLAGMVLLVLTARVLLVLHTYLTLKVKQERMRMPSSLEE